MKGIHLAGDQRRLYFTNYENRPDEEEYQEVISKLKQYNCIIGNIVTGPDCDLIACLIANIEFNVIHSIDGNGTFIYCENPSGMQKLEKIFS